MKKRTLTLLLFSFLIHSAVGDSRSSGVGSTSSSDEPKGQQQNVRPPVVQFDPQEFVQKNQDEETIDDTDVLEIHPSEILGAHKSSIVALSISPDEAILVAGSNDPYLTFWSTADGNLIERVEFPANVLTDLTITRDGTRVVVATKHGLLYIYDLKTRKMISEVSSPDKNVESVLSAPMSVLTSEDQVALGDCSLSAPTDPYVRILPHTVPQIIGSLHDEAWNASRERGQAGIRPDRA